MTTDDEMLDHFKIRQVLECYCRGVDRLDQELIDSVYWPEATDDHGVYVGPGRGFGEWLIPQMRDHYVATMHCISQSNIEVHGTQACADTYFSAYHRGENTGKIQFTTAYGRYVDIFEKRDDEWRISDRKIIMEHIHIDDDSQEPSEYGIDSFQRGKRDHSDPSYRSRKG